MNLTPNMQLASRLELQVFPDLLAKLKLLENMNDITENGRTRPDGLMNWPERPERHRDSAGPVIPDYSVLCISFASVSCGGGSVAVDSFFHRKMTFSIRITCQATM